MVARGSRALLVGFTSCASSASTRGLAPLPSSSRTSPLRESSPHTLGACESTSQGGADSDADDRTLLFFMSAVRDMALEKHPWCKGPAKQTTLPGLRVPMRSGWLFEASQVQVLMGAPSPEVRAGWFSLCLLPENWPQRPTSPIQRTLRGAMRVRVLPLQPCGAVVVGHGATSVK